MNSGPLSLRMCSGTPRMANSSASASITSSLVMLRSTFKARHSRVYPSTIDSHFKGLPLVVRSNTKSQVQTWFQTIGEFALDAQNPSKTGKSPLVWQSCYQCAELAYLHSKHRL